MVRQAFGGDEVAGSVNPEYNGKTDLQLRIMLNHGDQYAADEIVRRQQGVIASVIEASGEDASDFFGISSTGIRQFASKGDSSIFHDTPPLSLPIPATVRTEATITVHLSRGANGWDEYVWTKAEAQAIHTALTAELDGQFDDRRPHSRACGLLAHNHSNWECARDCPTCHPVVGGG
jgi:hypothetical protein